MENNNNYQVKNLQNNDSIQPAFYGLTFMAGLVLGGLVAKYFISQG